MCTLFNQKDKKKRVKILFAFLSTNEGKLLHPRWVVSKSNLSVDALRSELEAGFKKKNEKVSASCSYSNPGVILFLV